MIVEQAPSESASARRKNDGWTGPLLMLAAAVDELRILAWQQTKDGSNGRNPPEPIPRPGVKSRADKAVIGKSDGFETSEELAGWYASKFKQRPQQN